MNDVRTPGSPVASLAFALGLFQAVLGASVLVVPHWFASPIYRDWIAHGVLVGLGLLAAGFALLWVAGRPIEGRNAAAAFALSGANLGALAVLVGRADAAQATIVYGSLGLAAAWAAVGEWVRARGDRLPPIGIRPVVRLVAVGIGLLMMGAPDQYAAPFYDAVRPWLPALGPLLVALGAALLAADLLGRGRRRGAVGVGDVALGALLLAYAGGYVSASVWSAVLVFAALGLGTILAAAASAGFAAPWPAMGPNQRLVAIAAATALIATATLLTAALSANADAVARSQAAADSATLAEATGRQLALYMGEHEQALRAAAAMPAIRAMDPAPAGQVVRAVAAAFPGFATVSLVGPDAVQVVRSDDLPPVDLSGRPSTDRALAGADLGYGGVTTSVATGEPVVALAVPVRDDRGEVVGAVSGIVSLRAINAFADEVAAGRDEVIYALAENGEVVVAPGAVAQPDGASADVPAEVRALAGAPGARSFRTGGAPFVAGVAAVDPFGWSVVVARPEAEVLAGLRAGQDRAFALLLVGGLVLAAAGVGLSRALFRPVVALLGPIRALGEGRDDVPLPPAGTGEIGDVVRALGRMRDELRQRAAALRDSEERFRRAFEDAAVGIALVGLDGRFLQVNPALCELTGYGEAELLARTAQEITLPDDQAGDREHLARLLAGEIRAYQCEKRYLRKDGGAVCVLLSVSLLRDAAGAPLYFIGQAQDVTARVAAQDQVRALNADLERRVAERTAELAAANADLAEANERYRFMADAMPQIVWTARPDGFLDYYNRRWYDYTGMTHEQTQGWGWAPVLHPDDLQPCIDRWTRSVATGEDYEVEYRFRRAGDGAYRWHLGRALPRRDAAGRILQWVGTCTDIDDHKRAVEATAAANKELEAFAYSVSHDLRSPLRAIDGFSRVLEEDFADELSEDARRYLGRVRANAQKMGDLIDDLLAFSRLGRRDLEVRPVDPARIVAETWSDLAPTLDGRPVELAVGDLPAVAADPALLRQVFANLLGNAAKFTRGRDPAVIEVGGRRDPGEIVLWVRDNGAGFDQRHADKLFGVFQRLHRAEDYEGTGVGLALVQRIVHRHGGRIWAEGRPGEGATFWVTLPAPDEGPPPSPGAVAATAERAA